MSSPKSIYVPTDQGIFYTENFYDPSIQPIWSQVNSGLPSTAITEFHLDPFDQRNLQYALVGGELYKRINRGNWQSLLTIAQINTLYSVTDSYISSFFPDPTLEGRLLVHISSSVGYSVIYSDDYGATWSSLRTFANYLLYGTGIIRGAGNHVVCSHVAGAGAQGRIARSLDLFLTSTVGGWDYGSGLQPFAYNPKQPDRYYRNWGGFGWLDFDPEPVSNSKGWNFVVDDDQMWFNLYDENYQRLIFDNKLYVTHDCWTTINNPVVLDKLVTSISEYHSEINDQIFVGGHGFIGILDGEDDTIVTNISGSNTHLAPYTNSIPDTVYISRGGIQIARGISQINVHAVAIQGYIGNNRGIPLPGDRAAWDAKNYPALHNNDTDVAPASLHHTLGTGANQAAAGNHIHIKNKLDADIPPTVNDDTNQGYAVGSVWIDVADDRAYICVDATISMAVWKEVSQFVHAVSHQNGGLDAIKLDDLAVPDDNTDLDASTTKHGLMKKFPGNTDFFLRGDGAFAAVNGSGLGDVIGPSGAVDGHLAVFDGATGKTIKDGGAIPSGGGADILAVQVFS